MSKIRRLSDHAELEVATQPFWHQGVWECGDQRFTDEKLDQYEAIPDAPTRNQLKAERAIAVAAITATVTSGKTFDGDEQSQDRMARAIVGMQAAGATTITWTLADNTSTSVTLADLTEALILSGQQQAALWPIP